MRVRCFALVALLLVGAGVGVGCSGAEEIYDLEADGLGGKKVPSMVMVNGLPSPVETDYLPHVVECENTGAPMEALKAQAIAARTFLVHATQGRSGVSVPDGQEFQVYSCGRRPGRDAIAAVTETKGVYLIYGGVAATGQFVAGAEVDTACRPVRDPTRTERFVTRNEGKAGVLITPAPRPLADPLHPQNRGCMGQNLSSCLADQGYDTGRILRFFYAEDIGIAGPNAERFLPQPPRMAPPQDPAPPTYEPFFPGDPTDPDATSADSFGP